MITRGSFRAMGLIASTRSKRNRRVLVYGAGAFGRLLATMLFGVEPLDPMTFGAVTIVLVVTAAVSIVGPAWRATRIDPVLALRAE